MSKLTAGLVPPFLCKNGTNTFGKFSLYFDETNPIPFGKSYMLLYPKHQSRKT